MGQQACCCVQIENSLTDAPRIQQYQQAQLPDDPLISEWLTNSNIKIMETQGLPNTTMKHINKERYFVGSWKDGVPQGKVFIYDEGKSLFNGYYHNGSPQGQAHIKLIKDNLDFKGTLKHGKANGQGIVKNLSQGFSFEGEWQQSRPKKGTIKLNNDLNILSVEFSDFITGEAIIKYRDNRVYQGIINTNKLVPHGKGKVLFLYDNKKNSYEGDWKNGLMHGTGRFIWKDGSEYEGEYVDGRKKGKGKFIFPNQNYYDGFWVDGKQNGLGTLYSKTHEQLKKGVWKDGVFSKTLDSEEFEGQILIQSSMIYKTNSQEKQQKQREEPEKRSPAQNSRFAQFKQKYDS